ncbi:hypothetical protein AAG906_001604 [Vitis piasezkii]
MVMTWLVNSMNEEIGFNYMCYSTAKKLWDNVNHLYSDLVPLPKINKVFTEVRREESHRHIMLGKKSNKRIVEISTLSVAEGSANKTTSFQRGLGEKP